MFHTSQWFHSPRSLPIADLVHVQHRVLIWTMDQVSDYMCNELGVCQGPISHNNEQTQGII